MQYACSDRDADNVAFTVVNSLGAEYMGGAVTFESFSCLGIRGEYAKLYDAATNQKSSNTISVNVRRLDTILRHHAPGIRAIDLLAVDVEGWELEVMRGLSVDPKVVILENLFKSASYHDYMAARGYELWGVIEPNDIYLKR